MDCKEIQNRLFFYAEDDSVDIDRDFVQNHIGICNECSILYKKIKECVEFLNEDKVTETNPFFATRVIALLEKTEEQKSAPKWQKKLEYSFQYVFYNVLIVLAIVIGHYLGVNNITTEQDSALQEIEITDNQLFAEYHQFQVDDEEVYIINKNEILE
jgi:predicted anti-sigma-YlaC factor YlaD